LNGPGLRLIHIASQGHSFVRQDPLHELAALV